MLLVVGALTSPHAADGSNIFLSSANISDVFRQVANVGVISIGMTLVIITAGIDLSVGAIMGLGSVLTAMLLTTDGWNRAVYASLVLDAIAVFAIILAMLNVLRGFMRAREGQANRLAPAARTPLAMDAGIALGVAAFACAYIALHGGHRMPLFAVLWIVPLAGFTLGALNGWIITRGRMQPFIVTLAAMVGVLGAARLIAGQDTAVYSIYSGTNATSDIEMLRALLFNVVPVPALFFLVIAAIVSFVMNRTVFGKYLYAIGGNEKCTVVSGLDVARHKMAAYAISGLLSALVGVLYAAQYRQGKADADMGWELDAIAAVVIGGTSLSGGVGRVSGTVAGVLIFGFLINILLLKDIDSNTQLVLKGLIIVIAVFLQQTDVGKRRGWLKRLAARR
ncbi:Ribose ABC transport system, permease protein RbsC [Candidatus Burkholderia verschuerenii]|uniref:Ribose ABC transport system, permease protein RbsC n=1 Tax=Candidatus Burkholderia verschuerenii TaxID=242163 RepID=A0A0L0MID6_9BURK|nr:ABC transporter permease [Candidatus Burkholderia verschuerenii]KND61744.1 Ribose ABC transport system, permease protein RbsC [Candidatus Burkholderia verschuerenii]